jgi:hypothetical protein
MIVHVNLPPELARRLSERAAREGQTLEAFLRTLAEQEAEAQSNGGPPIPEAEEDSRPWRGVFAPDYPREELFRTEREVNISQLPELPSAFISGMRRLADADE